MNTTRWILNMIKHVPENSELWDEAVVTSNYIRNIMFSVSGNMGNVSQLEAFTGKKQYLSILRVFGSMYFKHVPKSRRTGNRSDRSVYDILIGYSAGNFYLILVSTGNGRRIEVLKYVRFDETDFTASGNGNVSKETSSADLKEETKVDIENSGEVYGQYCKTKVTPIETSAVES